MMIRILLTLTLAAGIAQGQSTTAKPPATAAPQKAPTAPATPAPAAPPAPAPAAPVAASDTVITIHGVCREEEKAAEPADPKTCVTLVTKEQFETLLDAFTSPGQALPPQMRQNLAQSYVDLLALAAAARKAGVQNEPRFHEVMRVTRLQTLAKLYGRDLQEKYRNPSQEDLTAYYQKNSSKFEELTLHRLYIPKTDSSAQTKEQKDEFEKKAQALTGALRDRAAKGEDLEKLEKEGYATLKITAAPVPTDVGKRRRGTLQPAMEAELFALKAGEVSKVQDESVGYTVYKVDSKQTVPLDNVKDEITNEMLRQNMDNALSEAKGSVHADFNEQYFGPGPSAPAGAQPPAAPPPVPPQKTP